jgi:hypothetical protein
MMRSIVAMALGVFLTPTVACAVRGESCGEPLRLEDGSSFTSPEREGLDRASLCSIDLV